MIVLTTYRHSFGIIEKKDMTTNEFQFDALDLDKAYGLIPSEPLTGPAVSSRSSTNRPDSSQVFADNRRMRAEIAQLKAYCADLEKTNAELFASAVSASSLASASEIIR